MDISTQLIKNTELGDGVGYNKNGALTDAEIQQNFRAVWQELDNAVTGSGQSRSNSNYGQIWQAMKNAATTYGAASTQAFTFVVDSNAKLATWRSGAGGTFTSVLIKAGSWSIDCSLASGVAQAGWGIHCNLTNTNYVYAEPGAILNFSNVTYATSACLNNGSGVVTSTYSNNTKWIRNVKIIMTNCSAGIWGFSNVDSCSITGTAGTMAPNGIVQAGYVNNCYVNLTGAAGLSVTGIANSSYINQTQIVLVGGTGTAGAQGIRVSSMIENCYFNITANGTGSNEVAYQCGRLSNIFFEYNGGSVASASVFNQCLDLSGIGSYNITNLGNGTAVFNACKRMTNCYAQWASGSVASSTINGFLNCNQLTNCLAAISNTGTASTANAFSGCTMLTGCVGAAKGVTASNAFLNCKKMWENIATNDGGTYGTGVFTTCYVDSGTSAAAGASAAGGWNEILTTALSTYTQ